jgi:hypothetical protein
MKQHHLDDDDVWMAEYRRLNAEAKMRARESGAVERRKADIVEALSRVPVPKGGDDVRKFYNEVGPMEGAIWDFNLPGRILSVEEQAESSRISDAMSSTEPGSPQRDAAVERHLEFARRVDIPIDEAVEDLIREGKVGRSYTFEDWGTGCVGREYFVWLRTPETADRDRHFMEHDAMRAAQTGPFLNWREQPVIERLEQELTLEVQEQLAPSVEAARAAHDPK